MLIGNKLDLSFNSQKGKQRLKRDGAAGWEIKAVTNSVLFSSEKGPWLLISNGDNKTSRWIHEKNDPDFNITMVY